LLKTLQRHRATIACQLGQSQSLADSQ